jgi:hypothetical protein
MKRLFNQGFALLPLILSVLVIVTLIGFGLSVIGPKAKRAKNHQTFNTLDTGVQSIINWSTQNGKIPIWGDGSPDATIDEFCEIVKETNDAWKKPLLYIYDNNLTDAAAGGVCGRRTTSIQAGSLLNVAFLIASGGADYAVTSIPNISGAFSGNASIAAEDIVRTVSLDQLKIQADCYRLMGGRLTILNNELPNACVGQSYTATVFAQGGVPSTVSPYYAWTYSAPLPAWITETPVDDHVILQGTPPAAGNSVFDVTTTDSNGSSFRRIFSVLTASCATGPGKVSEWNFDEGAGPTVNDAQGTNDGTLAGNTSWSPDTPDGTESSLSFDGNGDYVHVSDHESLRLTGELTLMAWVKAASDIPYAKIISRRQGSYFYFLGIDSGHPYGGVGDGTVYDVTGKSLLMSNDAWNHLSFVYSDTDDTMTLHFCGTERASSVTQNLPPSAGVDVSIGADSEGTGNYFVGVIDDVAVYEAVLTGPEIRAIYGNHAHPALRASYYFNGNASDASGNGHHGAVTGAAYVTDRFGNPNAALNFDGNDYVLVDDHTDLRFNQRLTITAWIKETGRRQYAKIVSRRSGNYFYFLGVDNGRPYGGIGNGSSFTVTRKSIDMPLNEFHFIAFVYNSPANSMHIYYDGILDETATTVSLPEVIGVDLSIGGDSEGTANFYEGLIDSLAIYNVALDANEIRSIYE